VEEVTVKKVNWERVALDVLVAIAGVVLAALTRPAPQKQS
jgi:hypothetical protein